MCVSCDCKIKALPTSLEVCETSRDKYLMRIAGRNWRQRQRLLMSDSLPLPPPCALAGTPPPSPSPCIPPLAGEWPVWLGVAVVSPLRCSFLPLSSPRYRSERATHNLSTTCVPNGHERHVNIR